MIAKPSFLHRLVAAFCVAFTLALMPLAASAREEIIAFDAEIDVAADGVLSVVETIRVRAEGDLIRRGIYRDFPLRMEDASGRLRDVGFNVSSVTRDGADEPYRVEESSGIARVYIGDADSMVPPGIHTYEIRYETDRQIRYFDAHDEVYWNVTGNGWLFPILSASAEVSLPSGATIEDLAVFTGRYGETGRAATSQQLADNRAVFATTEVLQPQEGLTIAVKISKGAIAAPSSAQERAWFWRDNAGSILAVIFLILIGAYYLWAWNRVGRDPPAGVVVPRWDPPENASPAMVNYIANRGLSGGGFTAIAAAILNLAVKGFVTLRDLDGDLIVTRTEQRDDGRLPVGERAVLVGLGEPGSFLPMNRANGPAVQSLSRKFVSAIESEHRGKFYRHNWAYVAGGIALTIIGLFAIILFGGMDQAAVITLVMAAIPGIILAGIMVRMGRAFRSARSLAQRIMSIIVLGFIASTALTIGSGLIGALFFTEFNGFLVGAIGAIFLLNGVFFFLMGAPTAIGARMQDSIAGLKQYLTLAEAERMNMQGAPTMSPRHFETLLPYAVALGVEKPWSQAFERWLATAAGAAVASQAVPYWFSGRDFSPGSFADSIGDVGHDISRSLSAAIPPAKSSSSGFSGGGGFSGAGGGGGGGGGW